MLESINKVVSHFFPSVPVSSAVPVKSGLINQTFKVVAGEKEYVLQRINSSVFAHPEVIHANLDKLKLFIESNHTELTLVLPLSDPQGNSMYFDGKGYFRFYPWVSDSITIDVVKSPLQAYEAARQFGKFTAVFNDFDASLLQPVLKDFHNLDMRFRQFQSAIKTGNEKRIHQAGHIITQLLDQKQLVNQYYQITTSPDFRLRVMHHDAKISNVLLDKEDRGLCVIDLDTVMPGYIISDWGDMVRTYVCPVSEEEPDFNKIAIRKEYFEAIETAYLEQLHTLLSVKERQSLHLSGQILVYMQALRFLTDFLMNDQYYGASYPGHNLIRADNQYHLLKALMEFERSTG